VTFADVAGVDEAKEELKEIIEFLKNPKEYGKLGARMPKGVLSSGRPAPARPYSRRAVAGEASVPFFSINGSEFVEMFVGVVRRACVTCSSRHAAMPRQSSLSTSSTRWAERAALIRSAVRTKRSRRFTSCFPRWMASIRAKARTARRNQPPGDSRSRAAARRRFDRQVLVDRPDKKGRIDILRCI